MKVEEILIREVKCCTPGDSLNRAAQLMWENDCGCVPVVDGDAKVVGILTDRDVCMAAYTQGATLGAMSVSSAMSRDVFACRPGDDLLVAQRVMQEHRVRRLPVTDVDGKLVGLLSLSDMARTLAPSDAGRAQVASTLAAVCAPHQPGAETEVKEAQSQRPEPPREGGRRRGIGGRESSTERRLH
jgi:CBS domain-containing protein